MTCADRRCAKHTSRLRWHCVFQVPEPVQLWELWKAGSIWTGDVLRGVRVFLIPGAVLVGFLVNRPVISQTSTAVAVGTLLVPLMLAARVSPLTTGAALLLGASLGGELLHPGTAELRTVSS